MSWAELGVEVDPDEVDARKSAPMPTSQELARRARIPVRLDRDKAVKELLELKASTTARRSTRTSISRRA